MNHFGGNKDGINKYQRYLPQSENATEMLWKLCHESLHEKYTDAEMDKRVKKLRWKLLRYGGVDILLTHAPAFEINDGRDLPHQGFRIFVKLIEKYKPKFFIHGHVHMTYGRTHKRYDKYQETHIINAYERCVFEYEADEKSLRESLK